MSATDTPRRAAKSAAASPAGPAPTIAKRKCFSDVIVAHAMHASKRIGGQQIQAITAATEHLK
jgi:hypothetical protein